MHNIILMTEIEKQNSTMNKEDITLKWTKLWNSFHRSGKVIPKNFFEPVFI